MIKIDGSYGEGGGQIVRTALFLSLLTGKPFRIHNIRASRKNPGLKMQHLSIIRALKQITESDAKGDKLNSTELEFHPGRVLGGNLKLDIHTAGSITLVLQTLLPTLTLAEKPSKLTIIGGTDVPGGMTIDYLRYIYQPFVERFSKKIEVRVRRRGYYPAGGGIVEVEVYPTSSLKIKPILLTEQGKLEFVKIISVSSTKLKKRNVAERQLKGAREILKKFNPIEVIHYEESLTPGCSILAYAQFSSGAIIGSDNIGKLGVPAEKIGQEAAKNLIHELNSGATVDIHLQDNIIPLIALAGGEIVVSKVTKHTQTNIMVTEKFLPVKFQVRGRRIYIDEGYIQKAGGWDKIKK